MLFSSRKRHSVPSDDEKVGECSVLAVDPGSLIWKPIVACIDAYHTTIVGYTGPVGDN